MPKKQRMYLYDPRRLEKPWEEELWESHPKVKKIRAVAEAEARETVINILRGVVVDLVEVRFPDLKNLAKQKVFQIGDAIMFYELIGQLGIALSEDHARIIMSPQPSE